MKSLLQHKLPPSAPRISKKTREGQGEREELAGQLQSPYSIQRLCDSCGDPSENIQRKAVPDIQRLTITRNGKETVGNCGQARVAWNFELGAAAPEDGYIVQKVTNYGRIEDCPSNVNTCPADSNWSFWEAWWVKKGDTMQRMHVLGRVNYTDASTNPEHPNTSGSDVYHGEVRFYKGSVTGDLGKENVASSDPNSDWGPGRVPLSGWLPSTRKPPAWWSTAGTEGPAFRRSSHYWNCCDGPQATNFNASP